MRVDCLKDRRLMRQTITSKKVAVLGYGNQGRAQAKNLRDNGVRLVIGARKGGASWNRAAEDGFEVLSIGEAAHSGDIVAVLLPDEVQAEVFEEQIAPELQVNQLLVFAHGFNLHQQLITPPPRLDVSLVAPLGPGSVLRDNFPKGGAVPALVSVIQDHSGNAELLSCSYCWGIGVSRVGVFPTTLEEETVTDLFAEQAVLCGGILALSKAAFETLLEAGYDRETAYLTCVHELQYTARLLSEYGPSEMLKMISPTAAFGALTRGEKIIPPARTKTAMKKILAEIQDGSFAKELRQDASEGWKHLAKLTDKLEETQIARTDRQLRKKLRAPGKSPKS